MKKVGDCIRLSGLGESGRGGQGRWLR
jgi:hypothetical protein